MTPGADRDLNFSNICYETTHSVLVRVDLTLVPSIELIYDSGGSAVAIKEAMIS